MTTTYTYHDAGALLSETHTGGTLNGINVQFTLDALLRRANASVAGNIRNCWIWNQI